MLKISPQTYNGYERGRNEPPVEALVRIPFLYNLPIDLLVQRDRLHKENQSAMVTLAKLDEEMAQIKREFKESELANGPQLNALMDLMEKMSDALKTVASNSKPLDK